MIELNKELAQLRRVVDPFLKHASCLSELCDTEELMREKKAAVFEILGTPV